MVQSMKFLQIMFCVSLLFGKLFSSNYKDARPSIKEYVLSVVNQKEKKFPGLSTNLHIVESYKQHHFPVMFLAKIYSRKSLIIEQFAAQIIDIVVKNDSEKPYVFFILSSPEYTLKVVLSKKRADMLLRAMIEHELGHAFYDHHCRHSAFSVSVNEILPALGAAVCIYGLSQWKVLEDSLSEYLKNLLALGLKTYTVYKSAQGVAKFFNSTWKSLDNAEQQADDFIEDDIELLQAMVIYFNLYILYHMYIFPSSNTAIKEYADTKKMHYTEYARIFRETCHKEAEKEAAHFHPLPEERIFWLNKRVDALKARGMQASELDPVKVEVYKGEELVQTYHL